MLSKDVLTRSEAFVHQYYKEPAYAKLEDITAILLNSIDSDTDKEMVATDDEPIATGNTTALNNKYRTRKIFHESNN